MTEPAMAPAAYEQLKLELAALLRVHRAAPGRLPRSGANCLHGLLRYGFRFIDTPGLGSSIEVNARTTRDFLARRMRS